MEAKRAVPRSEVSRDSLSKQQQQAGPVSGNSSPSLRSLSNSWSNSPSTPGTPGSPSITGANLTMSQIQCESRHACDPRISMDEYAYNKIFVGGLHYDTRDGSYTSYNTRSVPLLFNMPFFLLISTAYHANFSVTAFVSTLLLLTIYNLSFCFSSPCL